MSTFATVQERCNGKAAESLFVICSVSGLGLLIMAFLWFSGHGSLLRIAFPAVATLVGLVIYFKNGPWYVAYTLSLWFLSPLVRRIVDWHFGFAEPNFVLLAPLLVSGLGLFSSSRAADDSGSVCTVRIGHTLCSCPRYLKKALAGNSLRNGELALPDDVWSSSLFKFRKLRTPSFGCDENISDCYSPSRPIRNLSIRRGTGMGHKLVDQCQSHRPQS